MVTNLVENVSIRENNKKVIQAFYQIYDNENYLLRNNMYEVSISHKFALYLSELYKGFNVDIEWNKTETGALKCIDSNLLLEKVCYIIKNKLRENGFIDYELGIEEIYNILSNPLKYYVDLDGNKFITIEEINGIKKIKNIRPDIIIHSRGTKENNFCVLEIKKDNYSEINNGYAKKIDLIKLYAMTTQKEYYYKIGYYVEFPTGNNLDICAFSKVVISKSNWITKIFGKEHSVYEVKFEYSNDIVQDD